LDIPFSFLRFLLLYGLLSAWLASLFVCLLGLEGWNSVTSSDHLLLGRSDAVFFSSIFFFFITNFFLESKAMKTLASAERKSGGKIMIQVSLFLNSLENNLVDFFLILDSIVGEFLLLLALVLFRIFLEEVGLSLLLVLARSYSPEIRIIDSGVNLEILGECDSSSCGNDVSLINTTERNAIQTERSINKKESRGKLLQENNPSSSVTSSKKNQNCSGFNIFSQRGRVVLILS